MERGGYAPWLATMKDATAIADAPSSAVSAGGTGEEGGKKSTSGDSLGGQLGTKLTEMEIAMTSLVADLKATREELDLTRCLYSRSIQDRIRLKDTLNKMPPVDMDVLAQFIHYSLRHIAAYRYLTKEEKSFLTEADFTALKNWARR